jgi:hypothetical protein
MNNIIIIKSLKKGATGVFGATQRTNGATIEATRSYSKNERKKY